MSNPMILQNAKVTRSTVAHLQRMCPAVPLLEKPVTHHAAVLRPSQRPARGLASLRRCTVHSAAANRGSNAPNAGYDSQGSSRTASNPTRDFGTAGWNAPDDSSSASPWSDNGDVWPANADWGQTVSIGDWGETPSVGQPITYSSSYPQQGNQQHTAEDPTNFSSAGNASSSGYARMGYGSANYRGDATTSSSSSSSGSGSSAYEAAPPFGQEPYAENAAGTLYGSNSSSMYNSSSDSSYYTDNSQQQQNTASSWPFADASGAWQQQQQQEGARFQGPNMAPLMPSDITLVGRRDADSMLPLAPSTDQARYYQPKSLSERLVQIMGSFGVSVVLSKSAVLAGPALLYPIWGPWIRAGIRNIQMYLRQFKCVGLWRAEVIGVQINTVPYAYRQTGAASDSITITVGDPWQAGARTELTFPYQPGCEDIVEGEPAELLVLCQDDTFVTFKVVREVYLPQSGMWLSEYPFVDRDIFLDVSLAIERGRQAATAPPASAAATAAPGMYQAYGGYQAPYTGFTPPSAAAAAAASYPDTAAAPVAAGPGSFAEWVVPGSNGDDTAAMHNNVPPDSVSSSSNGSTGFSAADTSGVGPASNSSNTTESAAAGPSSTYGYATDNCNYGISGVDSSQQDSSASVSAGDNSSSFYSAGSASTGGLMNEFAGVASQFSGAATQVTDAAAHVAADVASGVAAGVAAGLGWINSTAVPNNSTTAGDSSSDTAVVPDVIIDNQGVWSPMGGYLSRGSYAASTSYGSSAWAGQQQMGSYGQPYVDQGFTGVYQRDAARFGTGRYAGPGFYPQSPAPAGFPAANGFNAAAYPGPGGSATSAAGPAGSNYYSPPEYSSYANVGAYAAANQQDGFTAQTFFSWQSPTAGQTSGAGVSNTAAGHPDPEAGINSTA